MVQFKIKRHTPLRKLMQAYCDRQVRTALCKMQFSLVKVLAIKMHFMGSCKGSLSTFYALNACLFNIFMHVSVSYGQYYVSVVQ